MLLDKMNIILVLLLVYVFEIVKGESLTNVENVLDKYFSPSVYNREIRGLFDQKQTMHVNLSFSLKNIKRLDEIEEIIEAFGVLFLSWKDERLVWDPDEYNGTDKVYTTAEKIWRPELTLENPATSRNFFGDITRLMSLHRSNGVASLAIGDIFEFSCSIDLTSFPWDKQTCAMVFVVWGYSANEVKLVAAEETIDLNNYQSNGVWTLMSTEVYSKPHPQKSFLAFEIVLRRRSLFFVVNILLPIVILSVLELFVFVVPIDSGERISFSLTVLLSVAVYMTGISDSLPPGAETMASMCYLLAFIFIESVFICLLNIISISLYLRHVETTKINAFWCKFVTIFGRAKWCRRPGKDYLKPGVSDKGDRDEGSFKNVEVSETIIEKAITWKEVSKTFDRVVSIFMTFLLIFTFAMYSYHVVLGNI